MHSEVGVCEREKERVRERDSLSELCVGQQLLHHGPLPGLLGDPGMIEVHWIVHYCADLPTHTHPMKLRQQGGGALGGSHCWQLTWKYLGKPSRSFFL